MPSKGLHMMKMELSRAGAATGALVTFLLMVSAADLAAREYHVGPGQALSKISDVPWAELQYGDHVFIHWRPQPYREKWVINRSGITVLGVRGTDGKRPVIDGRDAITAAGLEYGNGDRGVINIGSSADAVPRNIVIKGLEVRSAHPDYRFDGTRRYRRLAASIFVELAHDLVIRDCVLHDSGNGLFVAANEGRTRKILVEKNHIHSNGIVGRYYEHNAYSAALGITYQFNRFGPLRPGATGNNLKDRSAGLVVRYNWIEGGNRLLDLVEAEDSMVLVNHPSYRETHVYGNILIERDGGNPQAVHYGGDNEGKEDIYRGGTLYFYNNTFYSTRGDRTTLIRLSTNREKADVRNNILHLTAPGASFALLDKSGRMTLRNNWIKSGWVSSHETLFSGSVTDEGGLLEGDDPGFVDAEGLDFRLASGSLAIGAAADLPEGVLPGHAVTMEYQPHQRGRVRAQGERPDMGAYGYGGERSDDTGGGANGGGGDGTAGSDGAAGGDGGGPGGSPGGSALPSGEAEGNGAFGPLLLLLLVVGVPTLAQRYRDPPYVRRNGRGATS